MHEIDWAQLIFDPYENDYDMLHDLYVVQRWSMERIAKRLGVHKFTVRRRLVKLGIKIKGRGGKSLETTT